MPFRAFVALPLAPAAAHDSLAQRLVATGADVKASDPSELHMTLAFLGNVADDAQPRLSRALDEAVRGQASFDLALHGVGAFPNDRAPRVIWIGARPSPPLDELARRVREACSKANCPSDPKPFKAHATLGRVRTDRGGAALRAFLAANKDAPLPTMHVHEIVLFRSALDPGGARHEPLHRAALEA